MTAQRDASTRSLRRPDSRRRRRVATLAAAVGLLTVVMGGLTTDAPAAHADEGSIEQQEWPLQSFDMQQAWTMGDRGAGVVVAVVDSGVDPNQPDLSGSLVPGADFSAGQSLSDPGKQTSDMDSKEEHGTGMASIIAAHGHLVPGTGGTLTDGMYGMAPDARIMPIRVGSGQGQGDDAENVANGIRWAADHGARVINLSLGGPGQDPDQQQAIQEAIAKGAVVVAAAGNSGDKGNPVSFPAAFPGVVAVSGVDRDYQFWKGSEHGSYVVLAGPAVNVVQATGGGYGIALGTSGASAYASGEAALIVGEHPHWTAGQVVRDMIDTAMPPHGQRGGQRGQYFGYGVMNPLAALRAPAPAQTSDPLLTSTPQPAGDSQAGGPPSGPSTNAAGHAGGGPGISAVFGILGVLACSAIAAMVFSRRGRGRGWQATPVGGYGYGPPTAGTGPWGYQPPGPWGGDPWGSPPPQRPAPRWDGQPGYPSAGWSPEPGRTDTTQPPYPPPGYPQQGFYPPNYPQADYQRIGQPPQPGYPEPGPEPGPWYDGGQAGWPGQSPGAGQAPPDYPRQPSWPGWPGNGEQPARQWPEYPGYEQPDDRNHRDG